MFPQLEKVKRTTELGLVVEHLERKNRKIKKEFATKLGRVEQSCKAGLKKLEIVVSAFDEVGRRGVRSLPFRPPSSLIKSVRIFFKYTSLFLQKIFNF